MFRLHALLTQPLPVFLYLPKLNILSARISGRKSLCLRDSVPIRHYPEREINAVPAQHTILQNFK
jgi:hypothetical protein